MKWLVVLLIGCGSPAPSRCHDAATRVGLASDVVERRCNEDHWPPQTIDCVMRAKDNVAIKACWSSTLTVDQYDRFAREATPFLTPPPDAAVIARDAGVDAELVPWPVQFEFTKVTPTEGAVDSLLTIHGTGFEPGYDDRGRLKGAMGTLRVLIGGREAQIEERYDDKIIVRVPLLPPGPQHVRVEIGGDAITRPRAFIVQ